MNKRERNFAGSCVFHFCIWTPQDLDKTFSIQLILRPKPKLPFLFCMLLMTMSVSKIIFRKWMVNECVWRVGVMAITGEVWRSERSPVPQPFYVLWGKHQLVRNWTLAVRNDMLATDHSRHGTTLLSVNWTRSLKFGTFIVLKFIQGVYNLAVDF